MNDFNLEFAVVVKNLSFGYNNRSVLQNFSVKIKRGEMFSLLGSNGCGKTTILKLILGRVQPKHGRIQVLGQIPGHKSSTIPGPTVGYMPQEIGLMINLTVDENLKFFAKLFHLSSLQFEERVTHLTQLLDLCEKDRTMGQLSGGQQRVISLAIALLHRPKLIILDEPTVGVDPILRGRIWSYLNDMCRQHGNTVIITTHYIEEAKRASTVAFMKSGAILIQANPHKLMNAFGCKTLEGVYLYLWENDRRVKNVLVPKVDLESNRNANLKETGQFQTIVELKKLFDFYRVFALVWKFNLRMRKHPIFFAIFLAIPYFSLLFLYLAVGSLPHDIPVAVYSEEPQPLLSKQFIDSIDRNYLNVIQYESKDSAINSIIEGKNALAIFFAQNFTENFESRILSPFEMDDEEADSSIIKLYTDNGRSLVLLNGLQYLGEVLHQLMSNVSTSLGLNSNAFSLPLTIEEPIYGSHPIISKREEKFRVNFDLLLPGLLIVTFHMSSVVSSCFIVVNNRKDAHMSRFLYSGGQPIEIIVAHYLSVMSYSLVQVFLLLVFASLVLNIKQEGSYSEVYLLCVLQSMQGLSIGLMVALPLKREITILTIVVFVVSPLYYISGVFWPIEGIPSYFRMFADWTPLSKPIDALRAIMLKGWHYSHPNILIGYIVSLSYTLFITLFNSLFIQIHQDPNI